MVVYVPRSTWYSGTPTSNSGTPRSKLVTPVPTITRHYTGSPSSTRNSTWAAKDWMPWFQTVALASGKSYEYNYVIPPRADGSAQVWEYAGAYQAAHSAGENHISIGVLFAIGVDNHPSYSTYNPAKPTVWEACTDQMVEAYRWLRDVHLRGSGLVLPSVREVEHRLMPGAATACPGNSVIARSADLSAPFIPAEPEEPVEYFTLKAQPATLWATSDRLTAVRIEMSVLVARGVDPSKVPVLSQVEAARMVYLQGLTSDSVK